MWVLEASGAGTGHIHLQTRTFCPVLSSVSQKPQMIIYLFGEIPSKNDNHFQCYVVKSNLEIKKTNEQTKQNIFSSPALWAQLHNALHYLVFTGIFFSFGVSKNHGTLSQILFWKQNKNNKCVNKQNYPRLCFYFICYC